IRLGGCDQNLFFNTWIYTDDAASHGVYCDPSETTGNARPNGNIFNGLVAGIGGWYQPSTAASFLSNNFVYGYGKSNGEPDPQLNGTHTLTWDDEYGNRTTSAAVTGSYVIAQNYT